MSDPQRVASGLHPSLVVWTEDPLNAETPLDSLADSPVTPNELFFVRSHGPIPDVDAAAYRLTVSGLAETPLTLTLDELRSRFPRAEVTASLACAGNRRAEMSAISPIPEQVQWGAGATGNATWSGVPLRDVLLAAGADPSAGHVAFIGLDECVEEGEVLQFGASIPLDKAMAPEVLLADKMNGEPLPPEHGFPLRVIVPGYIGARSVKWLSTITVQREPSTNYFQARTYKLYPARSRAQTWAGEPGVPLGEIPVNSVVCAPREGEALEDGHVRARGYALTGGNRRIERVEVSTDQGESFTRAQIVDNGGAGSWALWEAELEVGRGPCELVVRAWDSSANTQPEDAEKIWNLKGYVNNAWHRVRFTASG